MATGFLQASSYREHVYDTRIHKMSCDEYSGRAQKPDPPERKTEEENPSDDNRRKQIVKISGSVFEYTGINVISGGAYGVVYRAQDNTTGEIVAVKQELHGLSTTSLREIEILQSLGPHPCIVGFKQVAVDGGDGVYVVMEYMDSDLYRYMAARRKPMKLNQVKLFMGQLLAGLNFLHEKNVMHRDLKPSNLLIDSGSGKLKICDFGLSRDFGKESGQYSTNVVTLWYRAPELLLGVETYSYAIDMWSVGCIMAEMVLKEAIFPGRSELDQLCKIYRVLGTPDERIWPGFGALPGSRVLLVEQPCNLIRCNVATAVCFKGAPALTNAGFDLLQGLLTYDPAKRIDAKSALSHAWFNEM